MELIANFMRGMCAPRQLYLSLAFHLKRMARDILLSKRWSITLVALLGTVMVLPTLNTGLIGDDFMFKSRLTGQTIQSHPGSFFGLFTFADGQTAHVQHLKDIGQVPWWAADHARMSFWRPLSELTHWLDYQLWPNSPVMMHVHSLLWYGLLICLLARLYRALDPAPLQSGVATLIFSLSAVHLMTVIWLAARNQLMAGCLLVVTLQFFHQWRQGQGSRYGVFAMLSLLLGLLSAEAAVATMAYLVAYAVAYEHGKPWRSRLVSLLPFLFILIAWRLVYSQLGYGSAETGGYIDPAVAPRQFAHALLQRFPSLLLSYLYGVTSSTLGALPDAMRSMYSLSAASAVVGSALVVHYFGMWSKPLARFFALGALLALVPVCAAESNDRLLLNAELGLSALLAMLFLHVMAHYRQYTNRWAWVSKLVVGILMVVHLLVYPLATVGLATVTPKVVRTLEHDEPLSLPDIERGARVHVILVNPPQALFVGYYPLVREYHGLHNADSTQALASGDQLLTLTAVSDRTIRMTAPNGFGEALSRDFSTHPFKAGDKVRAGQFAVAVEEVTPYGKPKVVRFEFDTPWRSASWRFYQWGEAGYVPFTPPALGQTVTLLPINVGKLAMARLKSSLFGRPTVTCKTLRPCPSV
jgi:hypothetical protein